MLSLRRLGRRVDWAPAFAVSQEVSESLLGVLPLLRAAFLSFCVVNTISNPVFFPRIVFKEIS